MAGKLGRSGRKSNAYERTMGIILDREIAPLLTKGAKYVNKFFDDPSISDQVKADFWSRFALRVMPQRIEGEGIAPQIITIIRPESKDGNNPQKLAGQIHLHRGSVPCNGIGMGNGEDSLRDSKDS